jgi:hypothetical protein
MQNLRRTIYIALALAAFAAAVGYPIYAGVTDSGPCRLLAEWQLALFGRRSRFLDSLILLMPRAPART